MKTTKNISRGVLKDFMILNFSGALLEISLQDTDAICRNDNNTNYKLNKRIDIRIAELRKRVVETLTSIGELCTADDAKYTKKRLKVVGELLYYFELNNINVNLELLALNILYLNFSSNERESQTVHENFLYFTECKNYLDENSDLIISVLNEGIEEDMFLLAYSCIERLRG